MPGTALWVDVFIFLPLSPVICLFFPGLDAWHSSLSVPTFVSLHLPAAGGCLAWLFGCPFVSLCLLLSPNLDAWHGSLSGRIHLSPFVSRYLAPVDSLDAWHGSVGLVLVVSQPGCLDSCVSLCPFICPRLSRIHARCIPRASMRA